MKMKKSVVVLLFLLFPFFLFACKSSSSSSGDNATVAAADAGPDASGIFTLNTSGADGGPDGGSGGDGGYVDIQMFYGSMGPLQVMASGAADASFTPTASTPNLGTDPVNITADKTIPLDPGFPGGDPGAGEPYMLIGDTSLYISDGNGNPADDVTATGLSVAAGTTLTLELNNSPTAEIGLDNDIDNDGTITTVDFSTGQRGNLQLTLNSYHGNGTIDTSGTLDGQSGGYVEINPNYSFFNNGSINTSGADSTAGAAGNGGYVDIYANYGIENSGNITTDGGAASGAGATGGSAGSLVWGAYFSLYNSGNLNCRGGDGVDGGGDGNGIELYAGDIYPGDLHNSGDLDTSGGEATAGDGGFGSSIDMYAYGGDIINSGNLTTKGGDTTDPDSNGGDGDYIYLEVDYQSHFSGVANYNGTPAGDVLFSGDVDASGGLAVTDAGAGSGGSGGYFWIKANYDYYPLGQQIALLGYSGIDTSGGDGNDGGTGGYVDLFCDYGEDYRTDYDYIYTAGCNMTNEVDINATGGSVVADATGIGAGGTGGNVWMETEIYYGVFYPDIDKVVNSGNIDTSGGDSLEDTLSPGNAGYVWIWGYNGVTNSGNIAARGGDNLGTGGSGYGNDAQPVELYAELGPVTNSGDLSTDGGDGEDTGGNAEIIGLFGPEVSNSGALAANGGDADPSVAESTGGNGADVELFSPGGMQGITQTGTVTNHGGTGENQGTDGDYYLGGQLL